MCLYRCYIILERSSVRYAVSRSLRFNRSNADVISQSNHEFMFQEF